MRNIGSSEIKLMWLLFGQLFILTSGHNDSISGVAFPYLTLTSYSESDNLLCATYLDVR